MITCATTCPVWNSLLNKLVYSGMCLAGGIDYRLSVALCESAWCNQARLLLDYSLTCHMFPTLTEYQP
jgi:hypothetical protein